MMESQKSLLNLHAKQHHPGLKQESPSDAVCAPRGNLASIQAPMDATYKKTHATTVPGPNGNFVDNQMTNRGKQANSQH